MLSRPSHPHSRVWKPRWLILGGLRWLDLNNCPSRKPTHLPTWDKIKTVCSRGLPERNLVASIIGVGGLLFWVRWGSSSSSCYHPVHLPISPGTVSPWACICLPLLIYPWTQCLCAARKCRYVYISHPQSNLCHHYSNFRDKISVLSSQIFLDFLMKFCLHFLPATWVLPFAPILNILQSVTDKGQGCGIKLAHHHHSQVHHGSGNRCGVVWVPHVVWVNGRTGNAGEKRWCVTEWCRWRQRMHSLIERVLLCQWVEVWARSSSMADGAIVLSFFFCGSGNSSSVV